MKCEYCDNKHNGNYGSGRFCNSKCAHGFSGRDKRKATNKKVSETLIMKHVEKIKKQHDMGLIVYDICEVYGIPIENNATHRQLKWSPYNAGRLRTIKRLARMFNIELGVSDVEIMLDNAVEKLRYDYHVLKLSGKGIKLKYGLKCHESNVLNFLKSVGIKRRTLSESSTIAIENGKKMPSCSRFKTGWHLDWEGVKHFYRSSYELDYYIILDKQKTSYETEKLRIKYYDTQQNTDRIAIPDILVGNTIYEIKSEYTLDVINMIDKVTEYAKMGYEFKLVLEHVEYDINYLHNKT